MPAWAWAILGASLVVTLFVYAALVLGGRRDDELEAWRETIGARTVDEEELAELRRCRRWL
jgi:hypothetical protein